MLQSSTLYPVSNDAFVGDYMGRSGFSAIREACLGVHFKQEQPRAEFDLIA